MTANIILISLCNWTQKIRRMSCKYSYPAICNQKY